MKEIKLKLLSAKYIILLFRKINPRWIIFSLDLLICLFSIVLAFLLRFNFAIPEDYNHRLSIAILLVLLIRTTSFIAGRVYAGIVRYTGIRDIFRVLMVNAIGSLSLVLIGLGSNSLFGNLYPVPFSVIAIDYFITVVFMITYRLVVKVVYMEFTHVAMPKTKVIIYGSKEQAILAKRALELDSNNHNKVVAFIGTSFLTIGKHLEGIPVFSPDELEKVIFKYNAEQLVFATSKLTSQVENSIAQICLTHHMKLYKIPRIEGWMNGGVNTKNIKELRIEDLLLREPIVLDTVAIKKHLENKTILVTGAAGSIGSEIVRQIMHFSFKRLILVDQAETPLFNLELEIAGMKKDGFCDIIVADITSAERMQKIFHQYKPEIVYHAAAYKHVPMMENNPLEAIRNNVLGTKILADLSCRYKVSRFIFISTDKAVNPTNVMGASKRIAEMYIQALDGISETSFITTRFGNVLGSNGSVIPIFQQQIENGGPVTVTHPEVKRYFMTIPEACQLVLEAGNFGKGGEIFVFDMGQSVKVLDLARNMIRLAGFEPDVDIMIRFTGLRPGEKLYEELLHHSENTILTHHPKILIAKVRGVDIESINYSIECMKSAISIQNNHALVVEMKKAVPEFISKNSIFEQIDKEMQLIMNSITTLRAG